MNLARLRTQYRAASAAAIAVLAAAAAFLPATPASAANPLWKLESTHQTPISPLNFHPEAFRAGTTGSYTLKITNTGDAATTGSFNVTDTLPGILTFTGVDSAPLFSCTGDGTVATPLDCLRTAPLEPGESDSLQFDVSVGTLTPSDPAVKVINDVTVSGGGAANVSLEDSTEILPPYGLSTFGNTTTNDAEGAYTVAGGHPNRSITAFSFPHTVIESQPFAGGPPIEPVDNPNGTYINPPLGFIGNPAAVPRCPLSEVRTQVEEYNGVPDRCPPGSQVGFASVSQNFVLADNLALSKVPLYNLVPERGYPAQFGFNVVAVPTAVSVFPQPRSRGYGLTIGTPNIPSIRLLAASFEFFGTPSQHGSGSIPAPFLSNPVDCSATEPQWNVAVDSQEHAGALRELGVPDLSDPNWKTASEPAPPVTGCDDPLLTSQFDPSIDVNPLQNSGSPRADQPSGLSVGLTFPQSNDPTDINTTFDPSLPQAPPPKDITVKLPSGVAISPASAGGLGACSDQASDPAGDQVHYDNTKPVSCPDSSKIGTALAASPLLASHDPITDEVNGAQPIPGDVYLLKPHPGDLPIGGNSDGKFRLLIVLENPRYGINFKLPGIATADKQTGQITAVFTENPQLPASRLTIDLKPGARAPLMTAVTCGKFGSTSNVVPWSTPGTPDANPEASFDVNAGPNGKACPATAAARPFSPVLETAGTDTAKAGAASPFTLKLSRPDGDQELSSLSVTTPPGFTAKLKGVASCSDAAIAVASGKSGAAEQASPSCPASSQVGTVTAGAGPGSDPYYNTGKVYLAGPYKGAPLSFAIITPVVAGPFDLGTVVVRAGVYLDIATAQVTVKTDPLPQILDGIPLRLRSLTTRLDRADFTLNPTNCQPMSVAATVNGANGATASPTAIFQVGGCNDLGFKPELMLRLKGKVSRRSHPSLQAHLTTRPGDANIAKAQVQLPKAAFLDNAHIGEVCTRVQFAAQACPEGSIYGTATATTPLLDYPLVGNVYLRSSSNKLPDLVVGFNGPASQPIEIELAGKTDSVKGALRNSFETVPDVPVTDFDLTLFGGKKGLIVMSSGFCAHPRADIKITGQNGMESNSTPKVAAKCPKHKKHKKGSR